MKYYLYRHIRLDKNEPFYIGVGTAVLQFKSKLTVYNRAFSNRGRNKIWNGITSRTNYEAEFLLFSDDYQYILEREIEFIKLYGKIIDGTGILSNITDGGEGAKGRLPWNKGKKTGKQSLEVIMKRVSSLRGKKHSIITKNKIAKAHINPLLQLDKNGEFIKEWNSIHEVSRELSCSVSKLSEYLNGKSNINTFKGYIWKKKT